MVNDNNADESDYHPERQLKQKRRLRRGGGGSLGKLSWKMLLETLVENSVRGLSQETLKGNGLGNLLEDFLGELF